MSRGADTGRPLRLLLVYETLYPDYAGGIETRNFELARALAARGHRVTLAGFGRPQHEADRDADAAPEPVADTETDGDAKAAVAVAGVERLVLGSPRGLYTRAGRRSNRRALGYALRVSRLSLAAYDVVETPNMPFAHLPGIALRCRAAGVPLLVVWFEFWGAHWREYVGPRLAPIYRSIERRATRFGARVAAISELVRGRLAALRGDQVVLAPCGVDGTRLRAAARDATPGPPLVVAGRLLAHKRIDLLLDALPLLEGVSPAAPLVAIYGDGPERARLESRAARLGIASRLVFHGQVPALETVWRGFGAARVAVHCSAREGFGLVPLEAMAAGLPVVFCRSPESAVGELVRDGIEGVATEASPAALAAALSALLADEPRRDRLAAAARRRAEGYEWHALAADYEVVLRDLVGRARGRATRRRAAAVSESDGPARRAGSAGRM